MTNVLFNGFNVAWDQYMQTHWQYGLFVLINQKHNLSETGGSIS